MPRRGKGTWEPGANLKHGKEAERQIYLPVIYSQIDEWN